MEKPMSKKFKVILVSALMTLSVVTSSLPAFATSNDGNDYEGFETGCIRDSDEVIEDHLVSDKEVFDLQDVNLADPALEGAVVDYVTAEASGELPATVDMTNQFPTPRTQGGVGSCVGWATAYALKSHDEYVEHGWRFTDKTSYSPSYVYNQINGGSDNGTSISTAMQLIVDQGVCPMYNMNYADYKRNSNGYLMYDDNGKLIGTPYLIKPNETQKDIALNYRSASYQTISGVDNVKKCLSEGKAVVIRITVYPDFDNVSRSNDTYDVINDGETSRGGHAVCLVGYDDANQRFKLMNSWGANWGLNGFCYISYDLFESSKCSNGYGYTFTDISHNDENEFFTEAPEYVVATGDVRAYTAPDFFISNIDLENYVEAGTDNFHHIIPDGTCIGIERFVPASNGVQPYFVTEDGYYISANKINLSVDTGMQLFLSGRTRFSYTYVPSSERSEKSLMYIYHDTNETYSGHGTIKIRYTMHPEDSYGGYDGAKVYCDRTLSTVGATDIGFWYMTPADLNGSVAVCFQGSVERKVFQLPTTNGQWVYYQNTFNFTSDEISDLYIYINGNSDGCVTNPTSGYVYMANMGLVKDVTPQKFTFKTVAGNGYVTGSASKEYYKNAYLTVTATPKNSSQVFKGWSKTLGGEIISTDPTYSFYLTENTTLYANYESATCYVDIVKTEGCADYAINGDENFTEEKEFDKNTTITISATGEEGYTFEGWYTNPEFEGTPIATTEEAVITVTDDMTLYPKYVSEVESSLPDSSSEVVDDTEVEIGTLSFGENWNWTKHTLGNMDFSNYTNVRFELVAEKGEFNKLFVNGNEKYFGNKTSLTGNLDGSDFMNVAGLDNVKFETEGNGQHKITFYGVRVGSNNDDSSEVDSSVPDSSSNTDSSTPDSSSEEEDDTEVQIGSLSFGETWNWSKHSLGTIDFTNYKNVRFELVAEKGEFNKLFVNGNEKYFGNKTSLTGNLDGSDFMNVAGMSNVTFETEGNGQHRITFYGVKIGSNDESSLPDSSSQQDSSLPDESSEPDSSEPDSSVPDSSIPDSSIPDSSEVVDDTVQTVGSTAYTFDYSKHSQTTGTVKPDTPTDEYVQLEGNWSTATYKVKVLEEGNYQIKVGYKGNYGNSYYELKIDGDVQFGYNQGAAWENSNWSNTNFKTETIHLTAGIHEFKFGGNEYAQFRETTITKIGNNPNPDPDPTNDWELITKDDSGFTLDWSISHSLNFDLSNYSAAKVVIKGRHDDNMKLYLEPNNGSAAFEGVSFNGEYTYTFSANEMSTIKAILQGNPNTWTWITSFEVWGIKK